MDSIKKHVEEMVASAARADKSEDAQRFSQAALNAAHAMQVLVIINSKTQGTPNG